MNRPAQEGEGRPDLTSDPTRLRLRRLLIDGYDHLKQRLTRRFGSASFASEVLHETWLELGKGGDLPAIANIDGYLYRAALHKATYLLRHEQRNSRLAGPTDWDDIEDEAPRPDRIVTDRDEVEQLIAALNELPSRQRAAFVECFRGETMPEVLAKRYDVSVRTIQGDIRNAILHCAERLGRKNVLAGKRVRFSRE